MKASLLQKLPIAPVLSAELAAQLVHSADSEGISLAQLKKQVLYTLWKHVQRYPIVMMLDDEENGSPGLHTFVHMTHSSIIKSTHCRSLMGASRQSFDVGVSYAELMDKARDGVDEWLPTRARWLRAIVRFVSSA